MLFKIILLITVFRFFNCDVEHLFENYKFDEISTNDHLNEKTENRICTNELERFWTFFQQNIDLNKDSLIDPNELKDYLYKQTKQSHSEDVLEQIERLDEKKIGKISFKTFVQDAFERSFEDLEKLEEANSEEFFELISLYKLEKHKWKFISSNSEFLDYNHFYKFIYSDEFPFINDYESKLRFDTFDLNQDNVIDVNEFKEAVKSIDDSLIDLKAGKFSKSIDLNSDNYLNRHEFQRWYNPSLEQSINEQKQAIFSWSDNDNDGNINQSEILNNCKMFLKSQVTNFGIDFLEKNESSSIKHKTEL